MRKVKDLKITSIEDRIKAWDSFEKEIEWENRNSGDVARDSIRELMKLLPPACHQT